MNRFIIFYLIFCLSIVFAAGIKYIFNLETDEMFVVIASMGFSLFWAIETKK